MFRQADPYKDDGAYKAYRYGGELWHSVGRPVSAPHLTQREKPVV